VLKLDARPLTGWLQANLEGISRAEAKAMARRILRQAPFDDAGAFTAAIIGECIGYGYTHIRGELLTELGE
jgi:hypothetical protein